jgi:hypothetical protein
MIDVKKLVATVICSAALAPLVPACGDESGGSCGKVQPCGGNLVGNYSVSAACSTDPTGGMDFGFNCPEASVGTPAISVSGSASFNADLTYTMATTLSATAKVMFPPSCLAPQTGGLTLTCDQINQLVPLLIASMPGTIQSATCAGGDTCTCTVTLVPQMTSESGTYNTSGNTLTTIDTSTGQVFGGQYCVQGNEVHYIQVDATMPSTIRTDTVLTKR